jgi:hypothetical protein
MAGHRRRVDSGQHGRLDSIAQATGRPKRMGEPARLQCALRALGLGAHVRAAARTGAGGIDDDAAVGTPHEPYEFALGAPLPTTQARARRYMLHAPVAGGSASTAGAAGASASGAGSARAASHSWAAV